MIVQLWDGPLVIGFGKSLDAAVRLACEINQRIGDAPTDRHEMLALIDTGSIKIRELPDVQGQ
jgi:hypothetical protein